MTSIALGTVFGSAAQIGLLPPVAQTPNENGPGVAVKARAWSGANPSCPCSTTANCQPDAGVPNAAFGATIVIVPAAWLAWTLTLPREAPDASTHTGSAKPCTSIRWVQADVGSM